MNALPENPAKGKRLDDPDVLAFYGHRNPWGEFSNFYEAPIEIDDVTYPTSEHYFQCMKFRGSDDIHADAIRACATAAQCAIMGRNRSHPITQNWELVKNEVMYRAIYAKFTQHARLRAILLATGERLLVEHTKNDSCWGDGSDGAVIGNGGNRLGQLLIRLREQLRGVPL